ncbi:hypothetical protein Arad_8986 [Rhizobium rhizogenes K84]|uniref:Uncharacterized protein n=1 Tax=Rhizobium rhizogenes (strain K84 / ATCC BAA-868) TaxID=311403 RepID=B9JJN8_RHIR8|nr:hypothetical protein Arad_8986 [Rhizobium rhizogenes K84]
MREDLSSSLMGKDDASRRPFPRGNTGHAIPGVHMERTVVAETAGVGIAIRIERNSMYLLV